MCALASIYISSIEIESSSASAHLMKMLLKIRLCYSTTTNNLDGSFGTCGELI